MEISKVYQLFVVSCFFVLFQSCNGSQASSENADANKKESRFKDLGEPINNINEIQTPVEDPNRFEFFRNQEYFMTSANYALSLKMGQFFGNDFEGYDIPFIGRSIGVAAITIENTRHNITIPDDIFFRQTIKLPQGYNRIYFTVELTDGRVFENLYVDTTIERVPNTLDIEITE